MLKCFSFPLIIGKILTFVFQGNYATLFIILFIAITLLKSLFYILARSRKPEESELPPYSPLEEHLKEGQYWLERGHYDYAKKLAHRYRVREYLHRPE